MYVIYMDVIMSGLNQMYVMIMYVIRHFIWGLEACPGLPVRQVTRVE